MHSIAFMKRICACLRFFLNLFLLMRITSLFLLAGILQVSAHSYGQEKINLSEKNASLEKVFTDVQRQSTYNIWFDKSILEKTAKVTIELKNATISEVMDA